MPGGSWLIAQSSLQFHFGVTSMSIRSRIDATSNSCRPTLMHFNLTSLSIRSQFEVNSSSIQFHLNFIPMPFRFPFGRVDSISKSRQGKRISPVCASAKRKYCAEWEWRKGRKGKGKNGCPTPNLGILLSEVAFLKHPSIKVFQNQHARAPTQKRWTPKVLEENHHSRCSDMQRCA